MKDLLVVTQPFTLEVLACLVMVLSMAVGVVCIGGYRVVAALSRLSLLAAGLKTSGAASNHTASTTDGQRMEIIYEVSRSAMRCRRCQGLMVWDQFIDLA